MSFVDWIERHRRSLLFIAFALAAAGLYAGLTLPVSLFPVVHFPRIRVEVSAGSMPAREMLIEVTEPLEEVARAVPGVLDVSSRTSRGAAQIFVDFPWGANMRQALLSVDAAFAEALPSLPSGTRYAALEMSPTALMPTLSYALISNAVSPASLRRLALYQVTPLLTGIPGVRRIGVLGGETPEVEVALDPQRLAAFGLSQAEVAKAIAATNTLHAVGRLEDNDRLFLTISNNAFHSIASVKKVALRAKTGAIIRLGDIAKVTMGSVPQWLLVDENGRPAVTVDVYQQDSADSLTLARRVRARLAAFMRTQPKSIHLYKWYDQTALVHSSILAMEEAIAIGLAFAALVILTYLRNWRVMLVAMTVVPLSVLITLLLLSVLGMTVNIMTLGGLAAAIGLLIDDVIVMIEHIARRAGVPGLESARSTVLLAAREFLSPLLGSSLATIIIFLPLAFLSGVTGAFFKYLSLTMTSALVISYILTSFTVPLLARNIIDFAKWQDPHHGRKTWLKRQHERVLGVLFAHPSLIALAVLVLGAGGFLAYEHVGTGFLPRMDEGGFVLDYQSAPGTSLAETNREIEEVEAILKRNPYVLTYSRRTGAGLGGDLNEAYQGDMFVRLKSPSRRPPIWTVMDEITSRITREVPGIRFDTHQLLGDMIGDMVGRRQPIVVELSAKNPSVLGAVARNVARAIAKIPGVEPASVNSGVVPAGDALEIAVNPAAAAMEGVTPAEVEAELYRYLHGSVVTSYLGSVQKVGVRVWLDPPQGRIYRAALKNLAMRAPDGHFFPLSTVARVTFVAGEPEITRNNLAQIVPVTAQIGGGHDLGSTVAAVKKALLQPGLIPPGVYYEIGGQYKQQQIAVRGMIKVFAAAALAEFILLLFLYESFVIPVFIIASSILATSAVFIGLYVTGVELNITAMMGMVMIIGISTEMAIFLVSEFMGLAKSMPAREALSAAAQNRLRPITMSTLALILALFPLGAALSGSGDQMLQPLAIAIISGVAVALPLVLLALPVAIGRALGAKPVDA